MKARVFQMPWGISLVETTIAIGVVAFALVALLALLPVGMKSIRASHNETIATHLLSGIVADVQTVPADQTESPRYGIPINASVSSTGRFYIDQNGEASQNQGDPGFVVDWRVIKPASSHVLAPSRVALQIAWPSMAVRPSGTVDALVVIPVDKK